MLMSAASALWGGSGCAYRLWLADKEGSSHCALSERALQRRARWGIETDSADWSVSAAYIEALRARGWQVLTTSRWLNTVVVCRPDGEAIDEAEWADLPWVTQAEQVRGETSTTMSAPAVRNKWAEDEQLDQITENEGQISGQITETAAQTSAAWQEPMRQMRGEALYDAGWRGQGMLVAVLDGGYYGLDQIPGLMERVVGWHDMYAPQDEAGEALWAASSHGTAVLSVMAADTAMGVWGTAPDARYYVIRTEYDPTECPLEEDMWVAGAEMADSLGADVINSSLGYSIFDDSVYDHTWAQLGQREAVIQRGAAMAVERGILVCCAGGNDRRRVWQRISMPADDRSVMTVGGVDAQGEASYFSSVGWTTPYVKPDVCARATLAWVIDGQTGQPRTGSGTSYACPALCGLMTSLWCADTTLTVQQLMEVVRQSASQATQPDSLLGYGIPNFAQALQTVRPEASAIETLSHATTQPAGIPLWITYRQNGCFIVQNGRKKLLLGR